MSATIELTRGYHAIVDDDWAETLGCFSWCATVVGGGAVYAVSHVQGTGRKNNKQRLMHRFLLAAAPSQEVDHVNGNGLDNRIQNLRLCTRSENLRNRRKNTNNTSGFKGVYFHKAAGKWLARLSTRVDGEHLGLHKTAEDAAHAYDEAALRRFGEFARLNFPKETAS